MMNMIAINGFGRIGRLALRRLIDRDDCHITAINDLTDVNTLAHLLKYDSVHGKFNGEISVENGQLVVNGSRIVITAERDPSVLPWRETETATVLECTGVFRDRAGCSKHIDAGARRVIISAPAKGDIPTVVLGVNEHTLTGDEDIISNASCTTNCLAPMVKVLLREFGIRKGVMTTIHAYTGDQRIHDAPHSDMRRARAAALNMVPTTTGAAQAVGKVIPEVQGKLDGFAVRVPVPSGSMTDLTVVLERDTTADEINAAMQSATKQELKGIVQYSEEPLVSSDIVGNPHSCIFDAPLTSADGNLVKVVGWYDNEMGYAARLAELAMHVNELEVAGR